MSWADYGFPDTTMMPCYLPAKALQLAFDERATVLAGHGSSTAEDYTPTLFVEENGRHFFQGSDGMFGGHCWTIPGTYMNHFFDFDTPVPSTQGGGPPIFWEDDDIESIIEAADTTGLGYLDPHMFFSRDLVMMPEWAKTWLEQRYLAMNLLKVAEVPFRATFRWGDTYDAPSGSLTTAQMAYDYALAHSSLTTGPIPTYNSNFNMLTSISHSYGHYSCKIRRIVKVEIDYDQVPHLAGLPAYIYVCTAAGTAWDPGYTFDNHGFPIRDGSGLITKIPLPWESEGIAQPAGGITVGDFGYAIRMDRGVYTNFFWQRAGVDVSSWFQLYDNVDAIAAGAA